MKKYFIIVFWRTLKISYKIIQWKMEVSIKKNDVIFRTTNEIMALVEKIVIKINVVVSFSHCLWNIIIIKILHQNNNILFSWKLCLHFCLSPINSLVIHQKLLNELFLLQYAANIHIRLIRWICWYGFHVWFLQR